MNDKDYIEKVKTILTTGKDDTELVAQIASLEVPQDADPLVALIHGDSGQLQHVANSALYDDIAPPSDEEIKEFENEISKEILAKTRKYLDDWSEGNEYHCSFGLTTTYSAFKNEHGDIEHIEAAMRIDAKTVSEALEACKDWEARLLERVAFYADQQRGHKRSSVEITYKIYVWREDKNVTVASGFIGPVYKGGFSTWLNQKLI